MCSNVFELACILDNLNNSVRKSHQITAVDFFARNIYIGTSKGTLFQLSLTQNNDKMSTVLINSTKLEHPTKIKQLIIAPQLNRILILQNSRLYLVDLMTLNLTSPSKCLRGVLSAHTGKMDGELFSIWTVRRGTVQLHKVGTQRFELLRTINCESTPSAVAVDHSHLCLGCAANYSILNIVTGALVRLFENNSGAEIHAIRVSKGLFLVSGPNSLGIFANSEGVSDRPPIQFVGEVHSLSFLFPYVISLGSAGLHIYSSLDQQLKQTFPFSGGAIMIAGQDCVLLYTCALVFTITPVACTKQIHNLISAGLVEEGLNLAQHVVKETMSGADFETYYKDMEANAAIVQFLGGNFDEADRLFRSSEFHAARIIKMYDGLVPANVIPDDLPSLGFECPLLSDFLCPETADVYYHFLLQFLLENESPEHSRCVDCALLLLALRLGLDYKLKDLIERVPSCAVEDCRGEFIACKKYHFLALLNYHKQSLKGALELWTDLENGVLADDTYPGLQSISHYIRHINDPDFVVSFILSVLPKNQNVAIKIFAAHRPLLELDDGQRESFLKTLTCSASLQIFYEHLVFELEDKSEDTNTELAHMYLTRTIQAHRSTVANFKEEDFDTARQRFRDFLVFSDRMRISDILAKLKSFDFLKYELCILYGKIGDHKKALDIIVRDLSDYAGAEEYCKKFSNCTANIYQTLFDLYVDICRDNMAQFWNPLVSLMENSGSCLDFEKVMSSLHRDVAYNDVSPVIIRCFRKELSTRRSRTMQKNLLLHKYFGMYKELCNLTNRPIVISRDTVCSVCGGEIAELVFAFNEDGLLCHRFCMPESADI